MKKKFRKIVIRILTWQAKIVLKRYNPKIVAITGSVGKTSTKDAVYTVLSQFYTVRKSQKSFNGEIGLPLTILGFPNGWNNPIIWMDNVIRGFALLLWKHDFPEYLVLEIGAGKPNDIISVSKWLKSDFVIFTRFPDMPVHVEFFKDKNHVIEEKTSLAYTLKPNGVLILNHDDKEVYKIHHKVKNRSISFGFDEHATYRATYPTVATHSAGTASVTLGMNFKLEHGGNTFPVAMDHIIGMNHVYSGLAAIACAVESGADILASVNAIAEYRTPPGRLSIIEGMNNSVIIDDTYNASPTATESALEVLGSVEGKRKIAVLGDMLELGKMTEEAHKDIGVKVCNVADILIVVGPRSRFIAQGANENGFPIKETYAFESSETCGKFLSAMIEPSDVILLKGSQGTRMERAVAMIMAHPEDAPNLLCRQEKEWLKR